MFPGKGKTDVPALYGTLQPQLDDLQERLYASSVTPSAQPASVLIVLQGMDTAGKGGIIGHVIGMVNPQGVHIHAFKKPTPEELQHDFLWRVRAALPDPGMLGIFDRSQYEDVLIARVESLASADEIESRYGLINEFEQQISDMGMHIIKCFLNVSPGEQRKRLLARLSDPRKYWKYNPADLQARSKWDDYMVAYGLALQNCNTDYAPWYVIPSDHKWYRNWAIAQILYETLESMNLTWPSADFDPEIEKARVRAS
ncbi:MAG: polyphosphate kinase 2 family protein [Propionibacteriaceae bacterium]|nr:polyphosphate kinase 2 family protein [Propionibacteriaceae bacterium]